MDTNKIKNLLNEVKNGTKTEEDVTKEIMKDYGKALSDEQAKTNKAQTELDNANTKIKTYETEITTLKESSEKNGGYKEKFEALEKKIKDQEVEDQKRKEDEVLTNNILNSFGDKKFASEYAKNGLIADIKSELSKPENKGKGITDIMESLTKDKSGIFENPNKPADMPGMGDVTTEVSKEAFEKMSYSERIKFKQENPEQFKEFNK